MKMKTVSRVRSLTVPVLDAAGVVSFQSASAQIALACASATLISLGAPTGVHAQDGSVQNRTSAAAPASAATEELHEIIVTGTRDPRLTASASLSPISVVSASQLEATGAPDLMDMLVNLSPSVQRIYLAPSYASGVDKITMRGLSSDFTLVMLNGIRRHTTGTIEGTGPEIGNAPSDLGMFPSSAIDHIEVLLEGASAQYGSDAIAGVANIILKNNNHGMQFSTNNGIYAAGDGFTSDTTWNAGFKLLGSGFLNLSAEYLHADHTVRSNPDERGPGTIVNKFFGNPLQNKVTVSYNAGMDLSENVQLYSFATYAHRVSTQFQYWRTPTSLPQIYPNGYEPQTAENENDYAFTVGLKGTSAGWDWDLSGTYGYDHTRFVTSDTANLALYADTGYTPTTVHNGDWGGSEATADFNIRRSFDVGLAGPAVLALGGEYRYDTWMEGAGEPASYYGGGTQGSNGFAPQIAVDAHHSVEAGYVDLALEPINDLKVDLAGRYETYSDSNGKATEKLSLRYDFTPAVAVRGTVSTGFRAPSLAQEYVSAIGISPTGDQGQLAVNSPGARLLGAQPLKPETSTNYSAGLVLHPVERMAVTVDAYQIEIKNRIVVGGGYNGQPAIDAYALEGLGTNPGVDPLGVSVQYFSNGVDTRTQGLDIVSSYITPFDGFNVAWNAAANFTDTKILRIGNDLNGNPLMNAQSASFITSATPSHKITAGADLTAGKWDVNLREILWGPTKTLQQYNAGPNAFSNTVFGVQHNYSKFQTDLQVSYEVTDQVKLAIGATNLFNQTPTKLPTIFSYAGVYKYDYDSEQMNFNGGFYYAKIWLKL